MSFHYLFLFLRKRIVKSVSEEVESECGIHFGSFLGFSPGVSVGAACV